MATFAELQKRIKKHNGLRARLGTEEILIEDDRGQMRPGDFIEQKLRAAQSAAESAAEVVDPEAEVADLETTAETPPRFRTRPR